MRKFTITERYHPSILITGMLIATLCGFVGTLKMCILGSILCFVSAFFFTVCTSCTYPTEEQNDIRSTNSK